MNETQTNAISAFSNFQEAVQAVLESLHNLEDWLTIVCKEMEDYLVIPNVEGFYNNKDSYNQLCEDYEILYKNHETALMELKSYKNDNKKLYDQNKKFFEDNIKTALVAKENKFFLSLLKNILRSHPYAEISKYYSEIINLNDGLLNLENDKIKLIRRIEIIERELSKCNKHINIELEKNLSNEVNNLRILISDYDHKINEKKEKIYLNENEIKIIDDKLNNQNNINVFKANYIDKNNNGTSNEGYNSRKYFRNAEIKKQNELYEINNSHYDSFMQENNNQPNFRPRRENQNKNI